MHVLASLSTSLVVQPHTSRKQDIRETTPVKSLEISWDFHKIIQPYYLTPDRVEQRFECCYHFRFVIFFPAPYIILLLIIIINCLRTMCLYIVYICLDWFFPIGKPRCGSNMHACENYRCISPHSVCDGRNNCGDGSDEKNCKFLKFLLFLLGNFRFFWLIEPFFKSGGW